MEEALIEHADSYIDELVEPQHLRAAPAAKAADERSNPPRMERGGGIGGGGGGGPTGTAGPLPPIGEEAREPPSGLELEPPPRDPTPQPPPSMVQTYVAGRPASGDLDEEVQHALVGDLPTPAADVRDEFCPSVDFSEYSRVEPQGDEEDDPQAWESISQIDQPPWEPEEPSAEALAKIHNWDPPSVPPTPRVDMVQNGTNPFFFRT